MAENIREQLHSTGQHVQETAQGVLETAAEQARHAAGTVSDLATQAKEKVQDWTHGAAERLSSSTSAVRDWGGHTLESTEATFKGAGQEMTRFIRDYPLPALLIGFGFGYMLSQLTAPRR
jgi:hypothetical protein